MSLVIGSEVKGEENSVRNKALVVVDDIHGSMSENLIFAANYIDNFFSNERMDEEGSKSKIVLSYLSGHDRFLGSSTEYVIRARLHLPKTEGRLRLVLDSTDESDTEATDLNVSNLEQNETVNRFNELKAALQYVLLSSKLWQVSMNSGMRFSVPPNPFVKFRVRRLFFVDKLKIRFVESLFWYKLTGWGEYTSIDVERNVWDKFFFRSSSRVTAINDTDELSFRQSFSLFQDIGQKKLLTYTIGANADLISPTTMSTYYINTRYRHNFYKNWAFYEVVPSLFFDRVNGFTISPGILFRLDLVLG